MIDASHILMTIAEESASSWNTPAWIIVVVLLNFLISIAVGIILLLTKSGIERQRDEMKSLWARLEKGENIFEKLQAKDAEVVVAMERKTGRVYEKLNTTFTTKTEHQALEARVYAMELGMATEITSIKAGIDRLTTDLGVIAEELRSERTERTKQQQSKQETKSS